MENGTIYRITQAVLTREFDAEGIFRIYAMNGEIYYGATTNTTKNATLEIYRGSERICVESIGIVGLSNRLIGVRPYMAANDIDGDGNWDPFETIEVTVTLNYNLESGEEYKVTFYPYTGRNGDTEVLSL